LKAKVRIKIKKTIARTMLVTELEKKISKMEERMQKLEHRLSARESAQKKRRPVPKTMLPTSEAAAYLGIQSRTLQSMAARKEIEYFKPGGKTLYFEISTLNAWMKRNRQASSKV